jgi:hypothetical protein
MNIILLVPKYYKLFTLYNYVSTVIIFTILISKRNYVHLGTYICTFMLDHKNELKIVTPRDPSSTLGASLKIVRFTARAHP